jgi:hypothetical protein
MQKPQLILGNNWVRVLAGEEEVDGIGDSAGNREGVGLERLDVASGMPTRLIVESPFWRTRLPLRRVKLVRVYKLNARKAREIDEDMRNFL